jgi:hypothetical protein
VKRQAETTPANPDLPSDADADPRVASFLRGVTIGALVGAAIAGSALWERAARRRAAAGLADGTTGDGDHASGS